MTRRAAYRKCRIDTCDKNSHRRGGQGYCENHWRAVKLYGDPLARRRPEVGAAWHFLETTALQYLGDECLIWPFGRDGKGYADIHNPGGTRKAHRVLCQLANGDPPSPLHQAAHSCGKGHEGCITKRHLSWKTSSQNQMDRVEHDTHVRGTRNVNAKFDEAQIREIRASIGISNADLGRRYQVNATTISAIRHRKTWGWLE